MAQVLNTPKELCWLERIRRWQKSQLSVRVYCRRQQLSEPSFYAWRRTLAERGLLAEPAAAARVDRGTAAPAPPAFVPLQLQSNGASTSTAALLEVVLADGRVLRVPSGFDAATLRQLLAVLEGQPC